MMCASVREDDLDYDQDTQISLRDINYDHNHTESIYTPKGQGNEQAKESI